MPRSHRYSLSSRCFSETGPEAPANANAAAPNDTQKSKRVCKLLEGVKSLKIPDSPQSTWKPPSYKGPAEKSDEQTAEDPPTEAALQLATLKRLPAISPDGRRFAADFREGKFPFADYTGEGVYRYLEDGMPGYEAVVGAYMADKYREHIEAMCSGDSIKIRKLIAAVSDTCDAWGVEEVKVSKYPVSISTSGVAFCRPIVQRAGARPRSGPKPPREAGKSSPEASWTKEEKEYSGYSGDESSASPDTPDTPDTPDIMGYNLAKEIIPNSGCVPAEQLKSKEWPQSPDRYTAATSLSSDCDADEDDSAIGDKELREMFPHQRLRAPSFS